MKFEEIQEHLLIFDKFVNIAIGSNLEGVDPFKVIRSYNVIRDFINKKLDKDES